MQPSPNLQMMALSNTASRSTLVKYYDQLDEYGVPRDRCVLAALDSKF